MAERLMFWKFHGLGNDYVLVDNRNGRIEESELSTLAKKACRRRFGVGADGLLLVYNSRIADIKMRIFNQDGTEAEMCGNGIRCLAKFCFENGIVKKDHITVETLAGTKEVWLTLEKEKVASVKVKMGTPIFEGEKIPIRRNGKFVDTPIKLNGEEVRATVLFIGNPHCVIFVENVDNYPVEEIGQKIESHELFPKRTNVEFVQVISERELRVRTWERGVGETLACGTGACASVVAAKLSGKVGNTATVHFLGGDLRIEFLNNTIFMEGPAEEVFEGYLNFPAR